MKKGFTLIELLVVVLIIGILSAVALPQYTKAVEKSRATEAFVMLKSLTEAVNYYYLQNGSYTGVAVDSLDITLPETNGKHFNFTLDAIYAPNHMDIRAFSRTQPYALVSGVQDGKRIAFYCLPSQDAGIPFCKNLGGTGCTTNAMCSLPM